jgi:uncharacterized protein (TIGR03437 family)
MTMKSLLVFSCLAIAAPAALAQSPKIEAIVNAASFESGLPYGGALATTFVSGLNVPAPSVPNAYYPGTYIAASSPLPYQLGNIEVTVCGVLAPILAVVLPPSDSTDFAQINFQVPLERNVAVFNGVSFSGGSCGFSVSLVRTGAGINQLPPPAGGSFFVNGKGYVVAQHASDYSTVTPDNPAHAGEAIIAYANDFFGVWPPPGVGLPTPLQPLMSFVAGASYPEFTAGLYLQSYPPGPPAWPPGGGYTVSTPHLTTTFLGLAPGLVGVEQVNFIVPASQQPGDWPLFFFASPNYISKPGVLLPVR